MATFQRPTPLSAIEARRNFRPRPRLLSSAAIEDQAAVAAAPAAIQRPAVRPITAWESRKREEFTFAGPTSRERDQHQSDAARSFLFGDQSVRAVVIDESPWFVLADVCAVLEIVNPRSATAGRLEADEKSHAVVQTPGGPQRVAVVSESGLYSVVSASRKPEARAFRRWVTGEVLPAIRRTGGYIAAAPTETNEALILRAFGVLQETVARQQAEVEAQRQLADSERERADSAQRHLSVVVPKAVALDRIATATRGSLSLTESAKILNLSPGHLIAWLANEKWIYRRGGGEWLGHQTRVDAGHVEQKIWNDVAGLALRSQVRITSRGLALLAEQIAPATRDRQRQADLFD